MKQFEIDLRITDAETGTVNNQSQPVKELTAENVKEAVFKLAELNGVFQNLSDDDVIDGALSFTDSEDTAHNAGLYFNKVKKSEILSTVAMIEAAFAAIEANANPTTTSEPAPLQQAPEGDEQEQKQTAE